MLANQHDSRNDEPGLDADPHRVVYGSACKRVAILLALSAACLATLLAIAAGWAGFALIAAFFGLMLVPLFLEFWAVTIDYDDQVIHTRSPWRKPRQIPMDAVNSCNFSIWLQLYRVRTQGLGTIRVHKYMSGIPEFLNALPCPTPPWPPPTTFNRPSDSPSSPLAR